LLTKPNSCISTQTLHVSPHLTLFLTPTGAFFLIPYLTPDFAWLGVPPPFLSRFGARFRSSIDQKVFNVENLRGGGFEVTTQRGIRFFHFVRHDWGHRLGGTWKMNYVSKKGRSVETVWLPPWLEPWILIRILNAVVTPLVPQAGAPPPSLSLDSPGKPPLAHSYCTWPKPTPRV